MFVELSNSEELFDTLRHLPSNRPILFTRPPQCGKTGEIFKLLQTAEYHKTSAVIFISDKNTALAGQTTQRAISQGWKVEDYRTGNVLQFIKDGVGKKRIAHFLMEINNLNSLFLLLLAVETLPVTIVIDEADKNRNTESASKKETDEEEADANDLAPVTKLLLKIKQLVFNRQNSRIIFMTATPQGILCSEKNDWIMLYKRPFKNYCGVSLDNEEANISVTCNIREQNCPAKSRWTGNSNDSWYNTFRPAVLQTVTEFCDLASKDSEVTQLCLLSLEHQNVTQLRLALFVRSIIESMEKSESVGILVFNGLMREKEETLASLIKKSGKKKLVVISGFMASRGVSFTDFSDADNKFELVSQCHYTKTTTPLNSAMQAMRIFGPARRTVNKPTLYTNVTGYSDIVKNFRESYRICKDIAEGKTIVARGNYDNSRLLTQAYNFRYLKMRYSDDMLLVESTNPEDHLPID